MDRFIKLYIIFSVYFNSWRFLFPRSINNNDYPIELRIIRDFIFILYIIYLIVLILRKRKIIIPSSFNHTLIVLTLMVFFAMPSVFFIGLFDYLQHVIRNTFMYYLLIFGVFFIADKKSVIHTMFLSLFFSGILGVILMLFFPELNYEKNLVFSTFSNKNDFGFLMTYTFIFYFYLPNKWTKKLILCFISFVAILSSGSTTSILAVCIFLILYFIKLHFFKINKQIIKQYMLLVISFITLYILVLNPVFDYQIDLLEKIDRMASGKSSSYISRIEQLNYVIEYTEDPIDLFIGSTKDPNYKRFDSQYYNYFYNHGLLFLTSFLIFILLILKNIREKLKNQKEPVLSTFLKTSYIFLLLCIFIFFPATAYLNRYPINFLFGIIIGLIYHSK